jgi:hypothetical protein
MYICFSWPTEEIRSHLNKMYIFIVCYRCTKQNPKYTTDTTRSNHVWYKCYFNMYGGKWKSLRDAVLEMYWHYLSQHDGEYNIAKCVLTVNKTDTICISSATHPVFSYRPIIQHTMHVYCEYNFYDILCNISILIH